VPIEAEAAEGTPLVGMGLLLGHILTINVRKQGTVRIARDES
jgi:hypothetical protein